MHSIKLPYHVSHLKNIYSKKSFLFILILFFIAADAYSQRLPTPGRIRDLVPGRGTTTPETPPRPPAAAPPVPAPAPAAVQPKQIPAFATVFPGAVPYGGNPKEGVYGKYYTNAPLEEVKAYYINEGGTPGIGPGRQFIDRGMEIFDYQRRDAELRQDAVQIVPSRFYSTFSEITVVLRKLYDAKWIGLISNDEYEKVEKKYSGIRGIFKEEAAANAVSVYERYNMKLDPELAAALLEKKIEEGQILMSSGRRNEGQAILNEAIQELRAMDEFNRSRKYVDEWLKCLEEMEKILQDPNSRWNVEIRILEYEISDEPWHKG